MSGRGRQDDRTDTHRRAEGLATLLEVSKSLAATLDLATVLQATTDGAARLAGLETAAIYLAEGELARLWATTPPLPPGFPDALRVAPLAEHPHLRDVIRSGQLQVVPDLATADLTPAERSVTEQRGLRSVLYLPLIAEVRCLGALIVGSIDRPRSVVEPELGLSRTLANLAALAVENAQLYGASRRQASELQKALEAQQRAEQERLALERQMLHAQKLESLGVLAGGIAHDFNNLLTAILGNLDLALRSPFPSAAARTHVEQSIQASRRAADLARQMLAYSGKGSFAVEPVSLADLVEENCRLFQTGSARTTTFCLEVDQSLPLVEADRCQVQQVIMNLIINASEAVGGKPGTITVRTGVQDRDPRWLERSRIRELAAADRFVFVEVSDTGCGMDDETQRRLFDPFFSTKATGRGLGMSAILGIVRGHGGAILVDSVVGQGSAIRVLFPALEATRPVGPAAVGAGALGAGEPKLSGTVLVVDDEPPVRDVCRAMVESLGMQALTAAGGEEAIAVFRREADRISHVILDLSMPNMDGMAAFRELSRIKQGARIILSSGYDEQDYIRNLSGRGLAGFIRKPYTLSDLRTALA